MKLEYLHSGALDCPMIRLYGNEPDVLFQLNSQIDDLLSGKSSRIALHHLPSIQSLNNTQVSLVMGREDLGVVRESEGENFTWTLSAETWSTVKKLLHALATSQKQGYQWLDETSEISFLCSRYDDGQW